MTSLDPTPADLDPNDTEANRIFVAFTKHGEDHERRGAAIVSSGLPVKALNWGLLRPPFDDVAETAAAVRACFAPGLPFRLIFRAEHRPALGALEARGWERRIEPTPAMTLAAPASIPPPPRGLTIRAVRTRAEPHSSLPSPRLERRLPRLRTHRFSARLRLRASASGAVSKRRENGRTE